MSNAWDLEIHPGLECGWSLDSGFSCNAAWEFGFQLVSSVEPTNLGVNFKKYSKIKSHINIFNISSMFITWCLTSSLFHWSNCVRSGFFRFQKYLSKHGSEHIDLAFTLLGTNISHLWKGKMGKIIFPAIFEGDMLVPWRVPSNKMETWQRRHLPEVPELAPPLALSLQELRSHPWAHLGFHPHCCPFPKPKHNAVGGSEIPNNHLECIPNPVNNGRNYQPQLVSRISEPSTVSPGELG